MRSLRRLALAAGALSSLALLGWAAPGRGARLRGLRVARPRGPPGPCPSPGDRPLRPAGPARQRRPGRPRLERAAGPGVVEPPCAERGAGASPRIAGIRGVRVQLHRDLGRRPRGERRCRVPGRPRLGGIDRHLGPVADVGDQRGGRRGPVPDLPGRPRRRRPRLLRGLRPGRGSGAGPAPALDLGGGRAGADRHGRGGRRAVGADGGRDRIAGPLGHRQGVLRRQVRGAVRRAARRAGGLPGLVPPAEGGVAPVRRVLRPPGGGGRLRALRARHRLPGTLGEHPGRRGPRRLRRHVGGRSRRAGGGAAQPLPRRPAGRPDAAPPSRPRGRRSGDHRPRRGGVLQPGRRGRGRHGTVGAVVARHHWRRRGASRRSTRVRGGGAPAEHVDGRRALLDHGRHLVCRHRRRRHGPRRDRGGIRGEPLRDRLWPAPPGEDRGGRAPAVRRRLQPLPAGARADVGRGRSGTAGGPGPRLVAGWPPPCGWRRSAWWPSSA